MRENDDRDGYYQGSNEEYEAYSKSYENYSRDYENYSKNYKTYLENYALYIKQASVRCEINEDKIETVAPISSDACMQNTKIEPKSEGENDCFDPKLIPPLKPECIPPHPVKSPQDIRRSLNQEIQKKKLIRKARMLADGKAIQRSISEPNQPTTRRLQQPPSSVQQEVPHTTTEEWVPVTPPPPRPRRSSTPPPGHRVPSGGFNFSKIPDNPELPIPPPIAENAQARTKEKITS